MLQNAWANHKWRFFLYCSKPWRHEVILLWKPGFFCSCFNVRQKKDNMLWQQQKIRTPHPLPDSLVFPDFRRLRQAITLAELLSLVLSISVSVFLLLPPRNDAITIKKNPKDNCPSFIHSALGPEELPIHNVKPHWNDWDVVLPTDSEKSLAWKCKKGDFKDHSKYKEIYAYNQEKKDSLNFWVT